MHAVQHKERQMTKLRWVTGMLALMTAIVGTLASASAQDRSLTKVIFSLDFIPLGRHAPWYAAIAEGYFKDAGLDVSIIPGQGGAQVIQAVEAGTADLGFMGVPGSGTGARRWCQDQNGRGELSESAHCGIQLGFWCECYIGKTA
jgi:ABC-type nitrate/sulfonate/bicarbonate transport system substrate-binding protein